MGSHNPSRNGGGEGLFTVALPKHGTTRCLSPLKNPPFVEYGGGTGGVHRGVAQARHCTPPIPPEKPTLRGMGGGQGVFTVASPKQGSTSPITPLTPPHVREKSNSKLDLPIFGDVPKAADDALTQRRLWKTAVGHCGERRWWRRQQRLTTTADGGCQRQLRTTTVAVRG